MLLHEVGEVGEGVAWNLMVTRMVKYQRGGYLMVLDEEGGVVVGERVSKLLRFASVRVAVHPVILSECLRVRI